MTPPAPCTSSAMKAATVSGPSRMIVSSIAMARSSPQGVNGCAAPADVVRRAEAAPERRHAGRRGCRERAAVIGLALAMIFTLSVLPLRYQWKRASLNATSLASEPLFVKKTAAMLG